MTKVLIACSDRVGKAMAGPAIRCWEMARLLVADGHQVHLMAAERGDREPDGFEIVVSSPDHVAAEAEWADVTVAQGLIMVQFPALQALSRRVVIDLYDPQVLEVLELFHDHPFEERAQQHSGHLAATLVQLQLGDFFLCASERQRDYWLGMLSGVDRINPHTHGDDRLLRRLIDVAPFGISPEPPRHSRVPAARGVLPGIEPDARLAIWGGGVYNWFDPLSLLRAWPRVVDRVPSARLLFLGMSHPNPDVPAMAMAARALELSQELGLRDRSVHFNLGWVDYDRRQDFLLEADVGVSMHFNHVETAYSFRTRILDYIWAGLPVVATEGDEFARWISERGTGRVVAYEDPVSIAEAMIELLGDDAARSQCAAAVSSSQAEYAWQRTLEPLARYCADPWKAADHVAGRPRSMLSEADARYALGSMMAPSGLLPKIRFFIRREGLAPMVRRAVRSLRRRLARRVVV